MRWVFVCLLLAGWSAPAAAAELQTACTERAARLREQLGKHGHVIERAPFVLAGDLTTEELASWHDQTVAPAARAMAATYFRTAPSAPITVLLFSGDRSYRHWARELFGDEEVSLYGYYKPTVRTLVMNIGTGGGTLVHELTHALADFDFPDIPAWFNEGLASLHEQCRFREDAGGPWIEGLENWRLPALQTAIKKGELRSLRSLAADDDFRRRLVGINYAQARYFCLYLQRQGKLTEFYRQVRTGQRDDPLGVKAFGAVLPNKKWEELDREFQAWVLTLSR
jgi:hypothetical protein